MSEPPMPHSHNAEIAATKPMAPKTRCPVSSISIIAENMKTAIIS